MESTSVLYVPIRPWSELLRVLHVQFPLLQQQVQARARLGGAGGGGEASRPARARAQAPSPQGSELALSGETGAGSRSS